MKLTPHDRQIVERMAPGVMCAEGFLGDDRRSLDDILADDASTVDADQCGIEHTSIGARHIVGRERVGGGHLSPCENERILPIQVYHGLPRTTGYGSAQSDAVGREQRV